MNSILIVIITKIDFSKKYVSKLLHHSAQPDRISFNLSLSRPSSRYSSQVIQPSDIPYMLHHIHSFIQTIFRALLQIHYYSQVLPTQHGYCVRVSRQSATGNCEWKICRRSPMWRLERDSNPPPFKQKAMNLPMSHHAPQSVVPHIWNNLSSEFQEFFVPSSSLPITHLPYLGHFDLSPHHLPL